MLRLNANGEVTGGGRALDDFDEDQHGPGPEPVRQPPGRHERRHRGERRDRQSRADLGHRQPDETHEEHGGNRQEQACPQPVDESGREQPRQEAANP